MSAAPMVGWLHGAKRAATYCGISERTLSGWITAGRVKPRRHSKRLLLFKPAELDKAVEDIAADFEERKAMESSEA